MFGFVSALFLVFGLGEGFLGGEVGADDNLDDDERLKMMYHQAKAQDVKAR